MLVLAIDTAHKNGSITLAQATGSSCHVLATLPIEGGAFSAQLVPRIAQALADCGLQKTDIEGYVACVGPGSFTGLRIGLSGIKGLAEVLPRPIAAVSSLEALAALAPRDAGSELLPLLDAGRSEFYAGEYRRDGDALTRVSEALVTANDLKALLGKGGAAIASHPAVAEFVRAAAGAVFQVEEVTSAHIAAVGVRKLLAGETISAGALDANYLRRDDALFAK